MGLKWGPRNQKAVAAHTIFGTKSGKKDDIDFSETG